MVDQNRWVGAPDPAGNPTPKFDTLPVGAVALSLATGAPHAGLHVVIQTRSSLNATRVASPEMATPRGRSVPETSSAVGVPSRLRMRYALSSPLVSAALRAVPVISATALPS